MSIINPATKLISLIKAKRLFILDIVNFMSMKLLLAWEESL